jgi:hypothetical protein
MSVATGGIEDLMVMFLKSSYRNVVTGRRRRENSRTGCWSLTSKVDLGLRAMTVCVEFRRHHRARHWKRNRERHTRTPGARGTDHSRDRAPHPASFRLKLFTSTLAVSSIRLWKTLAMIRNTIASAVRPAVSSAVSLDTSTQRNCNSYVCYRELPRPFLPVSLGSPNGLVHTLGLQG